MTAAAAPDDALRRIDAWLCDVKDLAIKDGLHIFARPPVGTDDPLWQASAEAERTALLAALDGRRVAPGPAGSPMRGRRDVLPTGRNLFTADPRTLPTLTAMDLGRLAADEVLARICKPTVSRRAASSSTCGAARPCAPAAKRSRKALR